VKEEDGDVTFSVFDSCPTKMAQRLIDENLGPTMREIFDIKKETFIKKINIPSQTNGDDCGIYMIRCIQIILKHTNVQRKSKKTDKKMPLDDVLFNNDCTIASIQNLRLDLYEFCRNVLNDTILRINYRGMKNNGKCCWIISTLQFIFTKLDWFHEVQKDLNAQIEVDKVWEAMSSLLSNTIVIPELQEKAVTRITGDWEAIQKENVYYFINLLVTTYPDKNMATLMKQSLENKVGEQDCAEFLTLLCDESKYCHDTKFKTGYEFLVCKNCNHQCASEERGEQSVLVLYFDDSIMESIKMQEFLEKGFAEETIQHRCKRCYCNDKKIEANEENMAAYVPDEEIPFRDHQRGKMIFKNYPDTLIISLTRASCIKLENEAIPVKMRHNVDIFENNGRIKLGNYDYSLEAVVYHEGEEPTHGHFWCESIRPTVVSNEMYERENVWHDFNDGTVKVLTKDHIRKCAKNWKSWKKRTSECALVMYKKENVEKDL
jgi:hypothetical protein